MNDEQLIWEAYTTKRNKKQQRAFDEEVETVYNLQGDEYREWSRKWEPLDIGSPEYKHSYEIMLAVEKNRKHSYEKYETIENAVNQLASTNRYNYSDPRAKIIEEIKDILGTAEDNAVQEGHGQDDNNFYDWVFTYLESLLSDRNNSPEVQEWYAKHGITA